MNLAVVEALEIPADSVTAVVSFRTERGRLYSIVGVVGAVGGDLRVRYTTDLGTVRVDKTLVAPNPAVFAVASDEAGTINLTYTYAADAAVRSVPLVVVKEITV